MQQTKAMSNIEDLIEAVETSYHELESLKLDNVFVTLMGVMEKCLADAGGNDFSLPHLKKEQRRRKEGELVALECGSEEFFTGCLARYCEEITEAFSLV